MKYDLIVCGAGPGGLAAAKTGAEDGLKVLLIERKKEIPEIKRLCGQFTNINMISVSGKYKYAYSEPLNLEIGTLKTTVHFPGPGFSIDYGGPLRPYYNYIHFSPSGNRIYRERDRFFAFFWEKESLLAGLLASAVKAGAEVGTETTSLRAENTPDGVKVFVRTKTGTQTLEAKKAIDAQGKGSTISESLGVCQKATAGQIARTGGYVLEGVETELRINSWMCITVPSLNRPNFWMYMVAGDRNILGTVSRGAESPLALTDKLMKLPAFVPWFGNARIVKKLATSGWITANLPSQEPVVGNVLILGEAAGLGESSNPGAIACGYQAAKATAKELNGQKGYPEYIDWWQKSFEGNDPNYVRAAARFGVLNALCSDEELDYVYELFQDEIGVPALVVGRDLERLKDKKPNLYERLKKTGLDAPIEGFKLDV